MQARSTPNEYTVLVVRDHAEMVRRFRFPVRWIRRGVLSLGATAVIGVVTGGHYLSLLGVHSQKHALEAENAELRSQIHLVQERVAHISETLERVEQLDAKLRTAALQLEGPDHLTADLKETKAKEPPAAASAARTHERSTTPQLEPLELEASRQESSLVTLQEYFREQRSTLASVPSMWPTRGWVTSDFGVRLDPYTAERLMHRGIDIASPTGQAIHAPADGLVERAGTEGGYGKVLIIDHGHGMKTRYGHLSQIFVKRGDRVKRGSRVAAVGTTGRSTGAHLHYEVRVDGAPENPRKFILE
jgi:murein DD-endopeptidase MepM/ murein hydrolase activator NlpD